jgi:hypothetical protein
MKLNGKEVNRSLYAHVQEDGKILLVENEGYVPIGYSRRKWDQQRILLTIDEIKKLAAMAVFK